MAVRRSATRRIPGNPLAGILRQTARNARSTTRRAVAVPGPQGEQGLQGDPGPPGDGGTAVAAILTTDADGVAAWTFPEMPDAPVVTAVAAALAPVVITVAAVGSTYADLMAWTLDGSPAPYVTLHVIAMDAPVDSVQQPDPEGP